MLTPHWLLASSSSAAPSVALTLSPVPVPLPLPVAAAAGDWFGKVEEGRREWEEHRKEATWRMRRVEMQMEAERERRRKEKREEIEMRIRKIEEEERAELERIEAECREQIAALRREAEVKEMRLVEMWAAKHARMRKLIMEQQLAGPSGRQVQHHWIPMMTTATTSAAAEGINGRSELRGAMLC